MKKLVTILAVALVSVGVFAQSPQTMSYQAVVRNNSNALVPSTTIGMQISILQKSSTGDPVYVEKHSTTTNANGLATIEIGGGTPVSGRFETIDWSSGPYFVKTETDPTGGLRYSITGTSQLLSVPYALYAEKSGNGDDMSSLKAQITALQTAVAGLPTNASITALQTSLTANATAIAAITTTLNTVATAGTATKAVVDGLKTDLTALATKIAADNAALKIQVTAIGTSNDAQTLQFTALTTDFSALATKVAADNAALKIQIAAIGTTNDAQTLQLTALVNANTALALQITAAQATILDAIATGNKASDDLLNTRISILETELKASGAIR